MKVFPVRQGDILSSPDFVTNVVLSSGVGQAFDVPTGARVCVFAFNQDFWARYGSTNAAAPSSSSTVGSSTLASELNPTARDIGSTVNTTGISVYSDSAAKGSIAWYKA